MKELKNCYLIDSLANMASKKQKRGNYPFVEDRYEPFIRNLRAKRPDVPIVMAGQCDVYGGGANAKDRYVKALYEKLVAEGWKNLVYLPKEEMFLGDMNGTVDGVHPNDWGMVAIAKAYGNAVQKALGLPGKTQTN